MKAECLNNIVSDYILYLTVGKAYDIIKEDDYEYTVLDDINREYGYPKTWFHFISEEVEFVIGEFYTFIDKAHIDWIWVIQFHEIDNEDTINSLKYYYMVLPNGRVRKNGTTSPHNWKESTPEEKQILIDAVQKETGDLWNGDIQFFEETTCKSCEHRVSCKDMQSKTYKCNIDNTLLYNEYDRVDCPLRNRIII